MRLIQEGEIVEIGSVVAIDCVDWGLYAEQHSKHGPFTTVKAMVYGEVIGYAGGEDGIVVSPQLFHEGDVRCTLVIPWCTVRRLFILAKRDDFTKEE